LEFSGKGEKEIGTVVKNDGSDAPFINVGDVIVKVDSFYFRPTEVETLLGDPSKAKSILKWEPEINLDQLINEMITNDLDEAKQNVILKNHGFDVSLDKEK
jgi:GDPmannose 4,6-dehydratase